MSNLRDAFDLRSDVLYLNSGTHSICPRSVLEAVTRYQREYELNPTVGLLTAWSRIWEVQRSLARFLNADVGDLILRPNVTEVMNAFILGAPLAKGSEILVSDVEYGAIVNSCRFRAERDGLALRTFHVPLTHDAAQIVDLVKGELRPNTSMLMFSHVTTGTGLTFPLVEIAKACRERGVLTAVDGAHAPGALALDFGRLGDVDFYGGNLHKWMMGPKGTAFGWVAPRNQQRLSALSAGWPTFECPDYFEGFSSGSRFAQRMAMLGCRDFAAFFAIDDMLSFWSTTGAARIRTRLAQLQAVAETEFAKLRWKSLSPPPGPLRGPMLTYEVPEPLQKFGAQLITKIYDEHKVQVNVPRVQGRYAVRISPHIYNTEDEIVRAANLLSTLKP
ncbi:MAG: aminotransferase class V-fold PLP-dependent enzyme [Deltaproteobacteria bacterium]|nr:aminotransferase class V-fold PLP-dependent enzyme [Deltaproteobacteria bacterium]